MKTTLEAMMNKISVEARLSAENHELKNRVATLEDRLAQMEERLSRCDQTVAKNAKVQKQQHYDMGKRLDTLERTAKENHMSVVKTLGKNNDSICSRLADVEKLLGKMAMSLACCEKALNEIGVTFTPLPDSRNVSIQVSADRFSHLAHPALFADDSPLTAFISEVHQGQRIILSQMLGQIVAVLRQVGVEDLKIPQNGSEVVHTLWDLLTHNGEHRPMPQDGAIRINEALMDMFGEIDHGALLKLRTQYRNAGIAFCKKSADFHVDDDDGTNMSYRVTKTL